MQEVSPQEVTTDHEVYYLGRWEPVERIEVQGHNNGRPIVYVYLSNIRMLSYNRTQTAIVRPKPAISAKEQEIRDLCAYLNENTGATLNEDSEYDRDTANTLRIAILEYEYGSDAAQEYKDGTDA